MAMFSNSSFHVLQTWTADESSLTKDERKINELFVSQLQLDPGYKYG